MVLNFLLTKPKLYDLILVITVVKFEINEIGFKNSQT